MRSNPYRLTLAILGAGFLVLGAILLAIGASLSATTDLLQGQTSNGPAIAATGSALIAIGIPAFIGWLVVRAIQWVPGAEKPRDPAIDAEYDAVKTSERDPNGLR
jgi:hypothetical protein